jgi:hypothetical protein
MLEQEENGLFEIPDYEHVEDETFPPFPPPASPERDPADAEPEEGLYQECHKSILSFGCCFVLFCFEQDFSI